MSVLHCIETQGPHGAQDTVTCTLTTVGTYDVVFGFAGLVLLIVMVALLVGMTRHNNQKEGKS